MKLEKKEKGKIDFLGIFYWSSYIVLLGVSTPHMAYFFSAYTDASLFEQFLSYAAACVIEGAIYIASYSIYKLMKKDNSVSKFIAIGLLILWTLICMSVSWLANSAHAAHFKNVAMLTGTDDVPFSGYFQYIAGAWPLFGIIYSFVSKIATENVEFIAAIIDVRTPEQIISDSEKQRALLIANANLERTKSEIQGQTTRARLKSGLGSTIGGTLSGLKAGFSHTDEVVEQLTFQSRQEISEKELEKHVYSTPLVAINESSEDPYNKEEYDNQLMPIPISAQYQDFSIDNIEEDTPGFEHEVIEDKDYDPSLGFMTTATASYNLWSEVRIVDAKDVKYSSNMPFFKNEKGLLFTSLKNAYQTSNKRNSQLFGSEYSVTQITPQALEHLVERRKIQPKYLRYVKKVTQSGRTSYTMTIAIHEVVRDEILSLLLQEEKIA